MVCPNTCNTHKVLYHTSIVPTSVVKKKCCHCLKVTISGYKDLYSVASPQHNFLFPMICNECSLKLQKCKWCRPMRTNIISRVY